MSITKMQANNARVFARLRRTGPELRVRLGLAPQAHKLLTYMDRVKEDGVSAREAMFDLDMTSATLSRRVVDLEDAGWIIFHNRLRHPVSGKRYTRYILYGFDGA